MDERRGTRSVDQIDHYRIVTQTIESKGNLIGVAPDRRCVDDDIVTLGVEVGQGNVRQAEQRGGAFTAFGAAIDQRYAGA